MVRKHKPHPNFGQNMGFVYAVFPNAARKLNFFLLIFVYDRLLKIISKMQEMAYHKFLEIGKKP